MLYQLKQNTPEKSRWHCPVKQKKRYAFLLAVRLDISMAWVPFLGLSLQSYNIKPYYKWDVVVSVLKGLPHCVMLETSATDVNLMHVMTKVKI